MAEEKQLTGVANSTPKAVPTKAVPTKEIKEPKAPDKFSGMFPYEIFKWVQDNIKVGKTRYNAFAKFNYRSVEDIYVAWKELNVPLVLIITDEINEEAGRVFIEALAEVKDLKGNVVEWAKAQAELGAGKAGMSTEQATGSASSYARKYALNGLFLLDDNIDPDDLRTGKGTSKGTSKGTTVTEDTKTKIKELQDLIRGNKELTGKATTLLSGRSVLKLTLDELNDIIKQLK